MEANRFDRLVRALTTSGSRRSALAALIAGTLGLLGLADTAARKGKGKGKGKGKKKRKKLSLPLPAPTCSDSVRNGSESDVDCGGSCRRCPDGKACRVANDCISGTCTGGVCVPCTPAQLCGSDANGSCRCDDAFPSGEPVCDTGPASGSSVDDCAKCPTGTETCVFLAPTVRNCYKRCGSP